MQKHSSQITKFNPNFHFQQKEKKKRNMQNSTYPPLTKHPTRQLSKFGMGVLRRGPIPFKFENMQLRAEGFKELLRNRWVGIQEYGFSSFILTKKLKVLKIFLKRWNRRFFGNVSYRKEQTLSQVAFQDSILLMGDVGAPASLGGSMIGKWIWSKGFS